MRRSGCYKPDGRPATGPRTPLRCLVRVTLIMYYLIDILKLLGLDQLPGACGQLKAARGVRVMGARFSKITCKRSASREYLYRRFFVLWFCFWDGLFPCPPSVQ